ncbi:hypothetical protein [Inquilinus sp. OTU3971]|uniref:hypothetical protein n=1 Tax=Inquilinus sp. OTU3971 TaxID=3043855 RepID=UPI00313CDFE4
MAVVKAVRRAAAARQISVWPAFAMSLRVYLEHLEGRHLTPNRLVQEVAPEFVSRATATRYIGDWANDGFYELLGAGRSYHVHPTPKLIALIEGLFSVRLESMAAEEVLSEHSSSTYRIIRELNGRIVDAENTELFLGYSPQWLIAEDQDILNCGNHPHEGSDQPALTVDRHQIWTLARNLGWLRLPWRHRDASGRMRPIVATIEPGMRDGREVLQITCEIAPPSQNG